MIINDKRLVPLYDQSWYRTTLLKMLIFFLSGLAACKMNVHKRCEKNVANNCGINTRDMADILKELGISGDKLSKPKKVQTYVSPV